MTILRHEWCGTCLGLAATAAVLLYGGSAAAAGLSVCVDSSSPMRAADTDLARAVARQEGAALRVHEYDSRNNDDVNGMADFHDLVAHDCDLVLGFPLDTDAPPGALGDLEATRPYAHTGFVLVTPRAGKATALRQLPDGTKVAVTYMTPPNLYFATYPALEKVVELRDSATLDALATGKVGAAMVWGPAVSGYLADHPGDRDIVTHPLAGAHTTFNLVALYAGDHAAEAAAFEHTVASLQASGALQKLLGGYAKAGSAPAAGAMTPPSADPPSDPPAASGAASDPPAAGAKPALYTAAQAASGKQKFEDNCALCHGDDLSGNVGPALKGAHFAPASAKYHVGDIFTIVSHNMPATQPGTLDHDTYVAIMAFLLQQNGYPAGNRALTYTEALQSKVNFTSEGK